MYIYICICIYIHETKGTLCNFSPVFIGIAGPERGLAMPMANTVTEFVLDIRCL